MLDIDDDNVQKSCDGCLCTECTQREDCDEASCKFCYDESDEEKGRHAVRLYYKEDCDDYKA